MIGAFPSESFDYASCNNRTLVCNTLKEGASFCSLMAVCFLPWYVPTRAPFPHEYSLFCSFWHLVILAKDSFPALGSHIKDWYQNRWLYIKCVGGIGGSIIMGSGSIASKGGIFIGSGFCNNGKVRGIYNDFNVLVSFDVSFVGSISITCARGNTACFVVEATVLTPEG
jgi:hypothetical protein